MRATRCSDRDRLNSQAEPDYKETIMENSINSTGIIQGEMFVTFRLDNDLFGINVSNVEEIIGFIPVMHIPDSADYLKGVINLRGKVVPVIDLRIKFRMEEKAYDSSTVILITNVSSSSVGMIVDSVSDVADIPCEMIHEYSHMEKTVKTRFIRSVANFNDELILIVETDNLLDDIEILPGEDTLTDIKKPGSYRS